MNPFAGIMLAFAKKIAIDAIESLADTLYDQFWVKVYAAIEKAEDELKKGLEKKQYVLDQIMGQIEARRKLSPRQKRALRRFFSWWIDMVIKYLNSAKGQQWRKVIGSLRSFFSERVPFLD